jgi:hypothetical protein
MGTFFLKVKISYYFLIIKIKVYLAHRIQPFIGLNRKPKIINPLFQQAHR